MSEGVDVDRARALLDFWFGERGSPEHDRPRALWFTSDPGFDTALRERFLLDHERAAAGLYDTWQARSDPCLALILLLDQLSRNLYRGTPRAFAADPEARRVARHAVAAGFDRPLPPVRRQFVYLPFEHSEDLTDQELGLRLVAALPPGEATDDILDHARRHHAIIARFGRFPHRNRVLGRASTEEEKAFLREPGSAF